MADDKKLKTSVNSVPKRVETSNAFNDWLRQFTTSRRAKLEDEERQRARAVEDAELTKLRTEATRIQGENRAKRDRYEAAKRVLGQTPKGKYQVDSNGALVLPKEPLYRDAPKDLGGLFGDYDKPTGKDDPSVWTPVYRGAAGYRAKFEDPEFKRQWFASQVKEYGFENTDMSSPLGRAFQKRLDLMWKAQHREWTAAKRDAIRNGDIEGRPTVPSKPRAALSGGAKKPAVQQTGPSWKTTTGAPLSPTAQSLVSGAFEQSRLAGLSALANQLHASGMLTIKPVETVLRSRINTLNNQLASLEPDDPDFDTKLSSNRADYKKQQKALSALPTAEPWSYTVAGQTPGSAATITIPGYAPKSLAQQAASEFHQVVTGKPYERPATPVRGRDGSVMTHGGDPAGMRRGNVIVFGDDETRRRYLGNV